MPRVRRLGGKSQSSSNPNRKAEKGNTNMRTKATINRLNLYKAGNPIRDRKGRIVGGDLMSKNKSGNKGIEKRARIAPNRKWFGNTKVIGQKELEEFREQMGAKVADPYTVVLKRRNLPMGLLTDAAKASKMNLLSSESYESVFGPKKKRKRVKLTSASLKELVSCAEENLKKFEEENEPVPESQLASKDNVEDAKDEVRESVFAKGQSKRIWLELNKVVDSSDIIVQVLDCRNPNGTRSRQIEKHIRENASHKHMIFVLNKVDLVPTWVTKRWVRILSQEYPTLAFHANMNKPFGKGALIQLLRQFALLHPEKKQISVGFIGYPNVGKSSIINTLRSKKVCSVAPIPGETKVWRYITLFKRVYLIDCPGTVSPSGDSEAELVMKGVVRAERLQSPEDYIQALLDQIKPEYVQRMYGVDAWETAEEFLAKLAFKRGKILKGGEPDFRATSQRVIYDIQRGRIPYFIPPPSDNTSSSSTSKAQGLEPTVRKEKETKKKDLEIPQQDFDELPQKDFLLSLENDDDDDLEKQETKSTDHSRVKNSSAPPAWEELEFDDET